MAIVHQRGGKGRLLPILLPLIPPNTHTFVDLFMGTGTMTLAMVKRCPYVIANDKNAELYNLFMTVKDHADELLERLKITPLHDSLFQHWKAHEETDPIWRAIRFLILSNNSMFSMKTTMELANTYPKREALKVIEQLCPLLRQERIKFLCGDYRKVFRVIPNRVKRGRIFYYADSPYLDVSQYDSDDTFTLEDMDELFRYLLATKALFGISHTIHPDIQHLVETYRLKSTFLAARRNLNGRQQQGELFITNYLPLRFTAPIMKEKAYAS